METDVLLQPIARDRASVLQNLFELYAHDFSEFAPLELKASGRFEVVPSDLWWSDSDHHPFFIHQSGKLAGFALARKGSRVTGVGDVMDVAEFFVVRGARGSKVGMRAAHALLATFPGRWEIRVRQRNAPAMLFWSRVCAAWGGAQNVSAFVSVDGVRWNVFSVRVNAGE